MSTEESDRNKFQRAASTSKSKPPSAPMDWAAHFILDDMKELAESKNPPQEAIDRWKTLQKGLGHKPGETITEAQYLMFAEALKQTSSSQEVKERHELAAAKADVDKGVASLNVLRQATAKTQSSSSRYAWKLIYWTGAVILFAAVFFTLPYWYYQLTRFIICGLSGICAFTQYNRGKRLWPIVALAIVVLFNPIVPIHFSRDTWQILDFLTAILMPTMGHKVHKSIGEPSLPKQLEKNITRPFSENKTKEEFREWLSIAPLWNSVDPKVIDAIINKFFGNPMFEVFYHISREADLIKSYIPLSKLFEPGRIKQVYGQTPAEANSIVAEEVYGQIVRILYAAGCSNCDRVAKLVNTSRPDENELRKFYGFAMDTLESSINIQPTFFPAYAQLAIVKHMIKNDDEARKFCNLGLAKVEELKKSPVLESEGLNLKSMLEDSETQFRAILKELGSPN